MITLKRINYIFSIITIGLLSAGFVSCEKKLEWATVEIVDPVRHYYPVVQGETMAVTYEIENTSDTPLIIQEIQTTCGCIIPRDDLPIVVLPKKTGRVRLDYNTTKNTGEVDHYIWLYGNFSDSSYRELHFDTNVVPPADYTRDYEEIYHERVYGPGSFRDMVDGKSSEKGYYTNDGDPRYRERLETQRRADAFAL